MVLYLRTQDYPACGLCINEQHLSWLNSIILKASRFGLKHWIEQISLRATFESKALQLDREHARHVLQERCYFGGGDILNQITLCKAKCCCETLGGLCYDG